MLQMCLPLLQVRYFPCTAIIYWTTLFIICSCWSLPLKIYTFFSICIYLSASPMRVSRENYEGKLNTQKISGNISNIIYYPFIVIVALSVNRWSLLYRNELFSEIKKEILPIQKKNLFSFLFPELRKSLANN